MRVLFEDEARFGRMSGVRTCWAPPGVRPVVAHLLVREFINAWATISPRDGQLVWGTSRRCDAGSVGEHLEKVARAFPREYLLVLLDGAGGHVAKDLVVPKRVHLVCLPPYSPELNPVEHLWDHLRENYFGNLTFDTLAAMELRLWMALATAQFDQPMLRSMTLFPWIDRACEPFGKVIV